MMKLFRLAITFMLALIFNLSANAQVSITPNTVTTYMARSALITPASSPTDVFTLYGSSTKTITVLKIEVIYEVSSGGDTEQTNVFLIKRSTANSGGTATTLTNVPLDSNNASATATATSYSSSNPTTGAAVGTIMSGVLTSAYGSTLTTPNGTGPCPLFTKLYVAHLETQGIVLRGTAQGIAVNLNGTVNGSSPTFAVIFTWTEK
jgi:hypothetical protein